MNDFDFMKQLLAVMEEADDIGLKMAGGDPESEKRKKQFDDDTWAEFDRLKKAEDDRLKKAEDLNIDEGVYAMNMPPEQDRETENVTYSKTKSKGDASVTISANAKSMQELHDVLKLAGITLPADRPQAEIPHAEPELDSPCSSDYDEAPTTPATLDYRYETDKDKLIDVIKQRLQKRLS